MGSVWCFLVVGPALPEHFPSSSSDSSPAYNVVQRASVCWECLLKLSNNNQLYLLKVSHNSEKPGTYRTKRWSHVFFEQGIIYTDRQTDMFIWNLIAAAASEPEANERGSFLISRGLLYRGLQSLFLAKRKELWLCANGCAVVRARNCGYARTEIL